MEVKYAYCFSFVLHNCVDVYSIICHLFAHDMKNPCRNCDDAYINQIGWHKPSSVHVECFNCEKRREYDELLDKHRRYEKGERIKSLDELNDCGNYVYVCDRLTHMGWLTSMQFRTVQGFFDKRLIYHAIDRSDKQ